jgi:hypothetical protein
LRLCGYALSCGQLLSWQGFARLQLGLLETESPEKAASSLLAALKLVLYRPPPPFLLGSGDAYACAAAWPSSGQLEGRFHVLPAHRAAAAPVYEAAGFASRAQVRQARRGIRGEGITTLRRCNASPSIALQAGDPTLFVAALDLHESIAKHLGIETTVPSRRPLLLLLLGHVMHIE